MKRRRTGAWKWEASPRWCRWARANELYSIADSASVVHTPHASLCCTTRLHHFRMQNARRSWSQCTRASDDGKRRCQPRPSTTTPRAACTQRYQDAERFDCWLMSRHDSSATVAPPLPAAADQYSHTVAPYCTPHNTAVLCEQRGAFAGSKKRAGLNRTGRPTSADAKESHVRLLLSGVAAVYAGRYARLTSTCVDSTFA